MVSVTKRVGVDRHGKESCEKLDKLLLAVASSRSESTAAVLFPASFWVPLQCSSAQYLQQKQQ